WRRAFPAALSGVSRANSCEGSGRRRNPTISTASLQIVSSISGPSARLLENAPIRRIKLAPLSHGLSREQHRLVSGYFVDRSPSRPESGRDAIAQRLL